MTAHLLSLAALHAAAPGVLDAIFGPDGDFEGGAIWFGPVLCNDDAPTLPYRPGLWNGRALWVYNGHAYRPIDLRCVYLDLRIPSVAARLAGLCARALGAADGFIWDLRVLPDGSKALGAAGAGGVIAIWTRGVSLGDDHPVIDVADEMDGHAFLAALTLALAPRIAALRSTP